MTNLDDLVLLDGTRLPRLGLGAMRLPGPGIWGPPQHEGEALGVLTRAVELGIRLIDTSDAYGPHVANDLIHRALHPYASDLLIATKVGAARDDTGAFVSATEPESLVRQVQENLQRLDLERLDLVYLRVGGDGLVPPSSVPFAESLGALVHMQDRGMIRSIGLSGVTLEQFDEGLALTTIVAVQNRFNLFDRSSDHVLAAAEREGVAFVPYFPLYAGMMLRGLDLSAAPPGMAPSPDQLAALDDIANEHAATREQVALAWILGRSSMTVAIPGTSRAAHVEQNLEAVGLQLDGLDRERLDGLHLHPISQAIGGESI